MADALVLCSVSTRREREGCQLCWYSAAYPAPDGSRTRESRSSLDVPIRYDNESSAAGEKVVDALGMGEALLVSRYAIGSRNSMEKLG